MPVSTSFNVFVPLELPLITSEAWKVAWVPLMTLFVPVAVIVSGLLVVSDHATDIGMLLIRFGISFFGSNILFAFYLVN